MNKDNSWIDEILIRLYQSGVNDNAEEMYNHRSLHTDEAKAAIEAYIEQILGVIDDYDLTASQRQMLIEQRQRAGITPQSGKEEVFEQD